MLFTMQTCERVQEKTQEPTSVLREHKNVCTKVGGVIAVGLTLVATSVYAGECVQRNCQDGWGVERWSSGHKYTGHYREGKRDGQGVMVYPNKTWYDGEWKNDDRHGHGANHTSDATYIGGWHVNKKHGKGYNYLCDKKDYKCGPNTAYATYNQEWLHGKNLTSDEVVPETSSGSSSPPASQTSEGIFTSRDGEFHNGHCSDDRSVKLSCNPEFGGYGCSASERGRFKWSTDEYEAARQACRD